MLLSGDIKPGNKHVDNWWLTLPFTQLPGLNKHARIKFFKGYNVTKRSWGYKPLRKFEVKSYLTFHSLLNKWKIT